ncbi:hypothetical protein GO730_34525 [Spirosoma sp. HMF3257]|uniref:UbiA family prenyltransferase n=2 Tax=Spirosoma telluris TaxID=2183553 RepID=A0A327NRM9_9BACT|nr:hypothetical protein [Spirosoma telluris]RAI77932.1 hypothetical protein HMF3257_34425 [Spirosoma telluris]
MVKRIALIFEGILQFVLFSNAYIALCAVMMCQTTARLFKLNLPASSLAFLFAGTLGSYSLHWYLTDSSIDSTNRGRWNQTHKQTLLGLFIGAVLVGLWLLVYLQAYVLDLLPVVLLTFLYSAPKINWRLFSILRRIAVFKSIYLALIWTYVTAALPLLMAIPVQPTSWVLIGTWLINRFLLIYSIALWFDYRDRATDRQSKWLTIASMLTETQIRWFFYGLTLCFGLTIAILYRQWLNVWPVVCLSVPMALLGLTIRRIATQPSDYGYYLYVDGLLMLSGILLEFGPTS